MSQMPDKIWLHKDTKYNTGDAVWGYQYKCAQEIEYEGIENFVEYVPVDAFIEKAVKWLKQNADKYTWYNEFEGESGMMEEFTNDFQKAMNYGSTG